MLERVGESKHALRKQRRRTKDSMSHWYEEEFQATRLSLEVTKSVFKGKSEFQTVEVFDTVAYGRALAIDGVFMTSERDEFHYHELLSHPALLTASDPKRVLVIGGGDGYPFPEDFDYVPLEQEGVQTGDATFADDGTEQDALAEYLLDTHATPDTAFDMADTGPAEDTRIQNLDFQDGLALDTAIDEFMFV